MAFARNFKSYQVQYLIVLVAVSNCPSYYNLAAIIVVTNPHNEDEINDNIDK